MPDRDDGLARRFDDLVVGVRASYGSKAVHDEAVPRGGLDELTCELDDFDDGEPVEW